jgi:hypothetical protein
VVPTQKRKVKEEQISCDSTGQSRVVDAGLKSKTQDVE